MRVDKRLIEFDWDKGNIGKNQKHGVTDKEAEEVFFDEDKVISKDSFHSINEERLILIGKTKEKRLLYLVYTTRGGKVRIISARDINKKEVKFYNK